MKSESIAKINWDRIEATSDSIEFPFGSHVYAIWPSPVNADACFESAGFTDFVDADESWDREFEQLVRACISALQILGEGEIRKGVDSAWNYTGWERVKLFFGLRQPGKDLDLCGQLILAASDDRCGDCIVGFGDSRNTTLKMGSGHSIIWIRIENSGKFDFSSLIEKMANGRPVEQIKLDWKYLAY